jgi:hypothetical protein
VLSASSEPSETGESEVIRVFAGGKFSAARRPRNAQSALVAGLDLTIPLERIVVARAADEPEVWNVDDDGQDGWKPRVRLEQIRYDQEDFKFSARRLLLRVPAHIPGLRAHHHSRLPARNLGLSDDRLGLEAPSSPRSPSYATAKPCREP